MDDPCIARKRRLLLATTGLTVGTLLAALGCGEEVFIANPKGAWYDGGGYDGGDGGGMGEPLDGNPKGAWYDEGGYDGPIDGGGRESD